MIYKLENQKITGASEIPHKQSYINIVPYNKLPCVLKNSTLSQKNLEDCKNMKYTKAEVYRQYIFGTINMPAKEGLLTSATQIAFYIDSTKIIFIGKNESDCKLIESILCDEEGQQKNYETTIQHFIFRFLYRLIEDDYQFIEDIEKGINQIEEDVLQKTPDNLNQNLLKTRKTLLYFHNFYERMLNIADVLSDNDYKMFSDDTIMSLNHLAEYLKRLDGTIHTLLDYSMQVQQIYQAEIDIKQNHIMKILTSVTTIFLPLTLIVGWYGMNFVGMPELKWQFGYPMVIGLSLVIICILIAVFKKNNYFK